MLHERVLRDCRSVEARRDDERSFRAGRGCSRDLSDRVARTLLARSHNERKSLRDRFSRRLNYLNVFSLIETYPLAGRAKHDIASQTRVVPLGEIVDECYGVKVFANLQ